MRICSVEGTISITHSCCFGGNRLRPHHLNLLKNSLYKLGNTGASNFKSADKGFQVQRNFDIKFQLRRKVWREERQRRYTEEDFVVWGGRAVRNFIFVGLGIVVVSVRWIWVRDGDGNGDVVAQDDVANA